MAEYFKLFAEGEFIEDRYENGPEKKQEIANICYAHDNFIRFWPTFELRS